MKQREKLFHRINAGQWIAIFVLGNALKWLGLGAWFIPMVIAVVGLHFLPLARLFRYRPHQLTGGALIALAILAPLASGRPDNAWGPRPASARCVWCGAWPEPPLPCSSGRRPGGTVSGPVWAMAPARLQTGHTRA